MFCNIKKGRGVHSKVTTMDRMFNGSSFRTIYVSEDFDLSSLEIWTTYQSR